MAKNAASINAYQIQWEIWKLGAIPVSASKVVRVGWNFSVLEVTLVAAPLMASNTHPRQPLRKLEQVTSEIIGSKVNVYLLKNDSARNIALLNQSEHSAAAVYCQWQPTNQLSLGETRVATPPSSSLPPQLVGSSCSCKGRLRWALTTISHCLICFKIQLIPLNRSILILSLCILRWEQHRCT